MFNTSIFPKACQLFAKHKNYKLLDESLVECWRSREVVEANDDTASEFTDSCCCEADMLDPTLAMATDKDRPDIQSQAACGVYDALDPRPTIKLDDGHQEKCAKAVAEKLYETKDGVQENRAKIEALLDSTFEEVLYPTARALTRLTRFTEPENNEELFWREIGAKIRETKNKIQGSSTLVADALGIVLSKLLWASKSKVSEFVFPRLHMLWSWCLRAMRDAAFFTVVRCSSKWSCFFFLTVVRPSSKWRI
mmetsp:Transcript_104644/g.337307  ORF Transcript_104644/g.337307 Transcript_104644/m.337307 type:complete len:251 (-) Transcript_104644:108-860(-)